MKIMLGYVSIVSPHLKKHVLTPPTYNAGPSVQDSLVPVCVGRVPQLQRRLEHPALAPG